LGYFGLYPAHLQYINHHDHRGLGAKVFMGCLPFWSLSQQCWSTEAWSYWLLCDSKILPSGHIFIYFLCCLYMLSHRFIITLFYCYTFRISASHRQIIDSIWT